MARAIHAAAFLMNRLGVTSTFHMQKLLYYAQSSHLALHREPLFAEPIEAWSNGPVVRKVFNEHRKRFDIATPWPDASTLSEAEEALSPNETKVLSVVAESLGGWSADALVVSTHDEDPWVDARNGLAPDAHSNTVIHTDAMRSYFEAVCLPSGREPLRSELSPAAFELYLAFAHERAFTPPTIRAEEVDAWHEMLEAPPREMPGLRDFLASTKV